MGWVTVDLRSDPDVDEWPGDPAEFVDAGELLLELARSRPWWHQHAACRGAGPRTFFPGRDTDVGPAKRLCSGCGVREECLAAALVASPIDDVGIWGGTSALQRRRLRLEAGERRPRRRYTEEQHRELVEFVDTTPDLRWRERFDLWNRAHPDRTFSVMSAFYNAWKAAADRAA